MNRGYLLAYYRRFAKIRRFPLIYKLTFFSTALDSLFSPTTLKTATDTLALQPTKGNPVRKYSPNSHSSPLTTLKTAICTLIHQEHFSKQTTFYLYSTTQTLFLDYQTPTQLITQCWLPSTSFQAWLPLSPSWVARPLLLPKMVRVLRRTSPSPRPCTRPSPTRLV